MLPPALSIRRVLDLGCGTGRFTEILGDSDHATVVGIDPSLQMLAQRAPPAAIPDEAFARGLAAFERHCRNTPDRPIYEPVEVFLFSAAPR
jgi:trans-aconitate methyltransferase